MKEKTPEPAIIPDWKWGTAEGSREFNRRVWQLLTFQEKVQCFEYAETLSLAFAAGRQKLAKDKPKS